MRQIIFARALPFIAFGFSCVADAQTTTAVGSTAGTFQVSEGGAAQYSIPVRIPPGVGGMEPKISLSFNSMAGNGLAGVGWSIEGLSAITRCPQTAAQDGITGGARGINYDSTDRYCLDGQRLVAITGAYGADGTEYRTERESFTKIISNGVAGNGPAWFKVWTKSGQVLEYGNTPDSRIEAQGRTSVRVYAANRISDSVGNYVKFFYTEDSGAGEYYPEHIEYGANATIGDAPRASVVFAYATRPDPLFANVAGSAIRTSVRLTSVRTYLGSAMLTDYRLAYEQGTATGRSRLIGVTECNGDGSSCLPQVTFAWQEPALISENWTWGGGHGIGDLGWQLVDLFGDGKPVYWTHSSTGWHYATRLNPDGTLQNWTWGGGHGVGDSGWAVGDLFGDGRQVYWTHQSWGHHYATRLNPDGTLQNWTWGGGHGVGDSGWQLADLFGDGRKVYWTHSSDGTHYATRLNPDGTLQNWTWGGGHGIGDAGWALADLFGEGRQLYWTHQSWGHHYATRLNPDGTLQNWTWGGGHGIGDSGWSLGNLFGDGREVYWTHSTTGWHYATRLNPDGTLQNWTWGGGHGVGDSGWQLVDLFGDGRQVYWTHHSYGWHYATRLNPDGTLQNWTWGGGHGIGDSGWALGDLFGDGRQVYWTHQSYGWHYATRFATLKPDLLTSINNGAGKLTNIAYSPLTSPGVYAKQSGATYPVKDVQEPFYVVSSASSPDGVGGTRSLNYFYSGAKADQSGGGFLGFQQVQTTDAATGIRTSASFRQDYPFQGLPMSSSKTTPSGVVLNQVSNSWADSVFPNATGRYHISNLMQTVETGKDLNGTVLPTVTTSTTYDSYGNAKSVSVSTGDGNSKVTANDYANDAAKWFLGRLLRSQVTSTAP
jgi:virulence plasmid B protein/glycosyltransferase TcdB-like subunit of Tc toxin